MLRFRISLLSSTSSGKDEYAQRSKRSSRWELMSESCGFIVAMRVVSQEYSPDTPSLSRTTLPLRTQSMSDANTLESRRFTSSTYSMFPSARLRIPFWTTGRPSRIVASMSIPPKSCSSVTFNGMLTTFFPVNAPAALDRTVLAEPAPPLISTVRIRGLTTEHSMALLESSMP